MARMPFFLLTTATVLALLSSAFAEEAEHDSCTCKQVEAGAQSTLKGGTCVRTEASNCLMEWGAAGNQKVSVGNRLSQSDAASKANGLVTSGAGTSFQLEQMASVPDEHSPLQIAIANLSIVPPEKYSRYGIPESYVLVAATALMRFNAPVDKIASTLLGERRSDLLSVVEKEGSFMIGDFTVKGSYGCFQIFDEKNKAQIYVKTPFATSNSC
jgi:hypothetical protein